MEQEFAEESLREYDGIVTKYQKKLKDVAGPETSRDTSKDVKQDTEINIMQSKGMWSQSI